MIRLALAHRVDQRIEHQLLHRLVAGERIVIMRREEASSAAVRSLSTITGEEKPRLIESTGARSGSRTPSPAFRG
jgi:hypothetical protein